MKLSTNRFAEHLHLNRLRLLLLEIWYKMTKFCLRDQSLITLYLARSMKPRYICEYINILMFYVHKMAIKTDTNTPVKAGTCNWLKVSTFANICLCRCVGTLHALSLSLSLSLSLIFLFFFYLISRQVHATLNECTQQQILVSSTSLEDFSVEVIFKDLYFHLSLFVKFVI